MDLSVDLSSEAFKAHPYPAYAALRLDSPVHRLTGPMGSEVFLITRYQDARDALADPRFSKEPKAAPEWAKVMAGVGDDEGPMGRNMLNSDPPDHTRQRRLVNKAFTPRRVEALAPRIQRITDDLLDAVAGEPETDLMAALAHPLPITVICELLGIPLADRRDFAVWTRMLLASPATEEGILSRRQGNEEMSRYLVDLIERMRPGVDPDRDPDSQPDLLSALIAPGREDQLDGRELLGMVKLLLVAGHETTVNHIGNGVLALLRHPEQLALLRSRPELLPAAVEEMLRYDGPIERVPMRFTTEDVEIAGTVIPKGSAVNIVLGSADRDERRFADPDALDIERKDNQHIAFGHGIHYCVGAPLARLESRIAFRSLLDRFPGLELACKPEELRWRIGGPNIMRGLDTLPVRLGTVADVPR
ncbi:cytochrome P450 [Kitasatospora sp. SUK 42]|uniref:cytochrome P450 family protein n=1 Tax=Kitasatospora sp. SUK 42 TaxID=1588882 RepID=UPI0018CB649F|nr:cytochrome P450 [Kitasatospora sp. SUK 42]MBV2156615.1 cytochrome P450 [Kitasatospora sp. SUK 42]